MLFSIPIIPTQFVNWVVGCRQNNLLMQILANDVESLFFHHLYEATSRKWYAGTFIHIRMRQPLVDANQPLRRISARVLVCRLVGCAVYVVTCVSVYETSTTTTHTTFVVFVGCVCYHHHFIYYRVYKYEIDMKWKRIVMYSDPIFSFIFRRIFITVPSGPRVNFTTFILYGTFWIFSLQKKLFSRGVLLWRPADM